MDSKVFFSWQSQNKPVRNKLKKAIEAACKRLDLAYDEATRDASGSPDITASIEEKIAASEVVIADVSIVHDDGERVYPNSNVLFETGYALGLHRGSERTVLVFDATSGDIQRLPFDIRNRRIHVITSEMTATDRANALHDAIKAAKRADEELLHATIGDVFGPEPIRTLRLSERVSLRCSTATLKRIEQICFGSIDLKKRIHWSREEPPLGVPRFEESADWLVSPNLTIAVCPIPVEQYRSMTPEQTKKLIEEHQANLLGEA
jgi:hypothetical protein